MDRRKFLCVAGLTVVGGGVLSEVLPIKPKIYTSPQGGDYVYVGHKCKHDADAADKFDREYPYTGNLRWVESPIEMRLKITYIENYAVYEWPFNKPPQIETCIIEETYLYLDNNRARVRELARIINKMHPGELFKHLEDDSELNARVIDGKQPYLNWDNQKIVLRGKPFRISMLTYRGVTT